MQTLFRLLRKFYFFLMFIILEVLAVYLYLSHFEDKRLNFLDSTSVITGSVYEQYHRAEQYLYLRHENENLVKTNKRLRERLSRMAADEPVDSMKRQHARFDYILGNVINNTVNKNHNYLTLNKGRLDSVKPEMGVIAPSGLVGIVRKVSDNYSLVISLLNIRLGISAKIKGNDYFGSVKWDGRNIRLTKFNEIPNYTNIHIGDTVVTSGYSAIFPEGIHIGTVKKYSKPENEDFYDITLELFTDFKRLNHVQIINNRLRDERRKLEDIYENESTNP